MCLFSVSIGESNGWGKLWHSGKSAAADDSHNIGCYSNRCHSNRGIQWSTRAVR